VKQILPIKETYVNHWGTWEAIREIVQNAKDEEDARGNRMTVEHTGTYLHVFNEGADMDRKVLLLGYTSKEGSGLRGHFGEGLNLALLAAARAGLEMSVSTQTERWVPSIEASKQYAGERVLVITSSKHATQRNGVLVKIKIDKETWDTMAQGFLFLHDVKKVNTYAGDVLLGDAYKGKCYVKGIFTCNHPNTHFGYDFSNVKVDRDRRMIDTWDLEWAMSTMLRECLAKDALAFAGPVFDMLEAGSSETNSLKHHVDGAALDALVQEFETRNGEGALPVRTMAESREIEHFGRTTAVVPAGLADILEKKTGAFATIQKQLKKAVAKTYAWADLTEAEKAVYTEAASTLVTAGVCSAEPDVQIVDFNDSNIVGLAGESVIKIKRSQLSTKFEYLATLIHEVAHMQTGAGDGDYAHVAAIEIYWTKVYKQLYALVGGLTS